MTVYVAFYKGRPKPGSPLRDRLKYVFDGVIRIFTRSPYSHCELAIADEARAGVYFPYTRLKPPALAGEL